MSHQLGRVVSQILQSYFGEIVQKVGNDLFTYGSKPIGLIVKTTGLPRVQVIESLRTLLKFDLATFEATDVIVDYKLNPDNILLLIRYPRYLLQMKSKYGSEAEMIVEELLQQASCTVTVLLVTVMNKYKDDKEKKLDMVNLKDTFISLATAGYIQQAPVAELKEGSEIPTLVPVATIVPNLDVRDLIQAMNTNLADVKDNIYWKVNYERFHLDFRDDIMIKAITRRIDENAGELMRILLEQTYLSSSAWGAEGCAVPAADLRLAVARLADRPLLAAHVDHYLKVIEENGAGFVRPSGDAGGGQYSVRLKRASEELLEALLDHTVTERLDSKTENGAGFVRRSGDAGGGQYSVRLKRASEELLEALLDHTVTERLGSKAARIFRLIRSKKYIEEEDIQKNAMLPNKECKELTYKLLEEHFISVQPMKKAASSGAMAKAIYLYHVKLHDVAHSVQQMCHSALHNTLCTGEALRRSHARLLDKQRRVRSIVHGMRVRGEPQRHIDDVLETLTPPELGALRAAEGKGKTLDAAQLALDGALFILHCYFMYPRT